MPAADATAAAPQASRTSSTRRGCSWGATTRCGASPPRCWTAASAPLLLGYIEKGTRMPSEALVRRLAAVRKQDPQEMLALLWRDRLLQAFGRELRRVLRAPQGIGGIDDAELAVLVSQAIAALPEDGSWIPVARWRRAFRATPRGPAGGGRSGAARDRRCRDGAQGSANWSRSAAARCAAAATTSSPRPRPSAGRMGLEFCALFVKALLDKLVLADVNTGTYLRNHYLYVDPEQLPEIQRRLDEAVVKIADEFARGPGPQRKFLNMLITSTPF